jgi:predicted nucleic acid-binding protein
MVSAQVFVETNFLFHVFCMPSKRHRDALALKARFDANEVKLYVPYVCFQEARNLIAKNLLAAAAGMTSSSSIDSP